MAEFQEVMKQLRRMCKTNNCSKCEMYKKDLEGVCHFSIPPEMIHQCEQIVMQWAAEHPEPVYPTWMEWLTDIGAIPKVISWDEPLIETVYDSIQQPIPADKAEKLGLKPKEG